jgi:RNA polymerase sigma-70 factor (family 1)
VNSYALYTDEALLALIRQGDKTAFDAIYDRYWASLYGTARKMFVRAEQAEDIVQELFINLWVKRDDYQIDQLNGYLRTALRSRVMNYVTRDQVRESFYEPFESILKVDFQAEELVREKELLALVAAYVGSLPPKRKEIFLMHFEKQMNTAEIAEALSISQKTVQNQLYTAIQGLRSTLGAFFVLALTQHY